MEFLGNELQFKASLCSLLTKTGVVLHSGIPGLGKRSYIEKACDEHNVDYVTVDKTCSVDTVRKTLYSRDSKSEVVIWDEPQLCSDTMLDAFLIPLEEHKSGCGFHLVSSDHGRISETIISRIDHRITYGRVNSDLLNKVHSFPYNNGGSPGLASLINENELFRDFLRLINSEAIVQEVFRDKWKYSGLKDPILKPYL